MGVGGRPALRAAQVPLAGAKRLAGTQEEALLNGRYLRRAFDKLGKKRPHHSSLGLQLCQRKFSQFRELCSS
jgi:hypothetical protein